MSVGRQLIKSPRLFIRERKSKKLYLIDSGSDVTVVPFSRSLRIDSSIKYCIRAANGANIIVYGMATIIVDLGFGLQTWQAVVADVAVPIIGADFLAHFHILPDLRNKVLVDGSTLRSVTGKTYSTNITSVSLIFSTEHPHPEVQQIFKEFSDLLLTPRYRDTPHKTMHFIETTGQPVFQRPYRLSRKDADIVKSEYL